MGETSWFGPRIVVLYKKQVTWLILSLYIIVYVFIFIVINKANIHEYVCLLRNLLLFLQ